MYSVYNVSFSANPDSWKEQAKFYLNGSNTKKGISFGYLFNGINENMRGYIKAYVSNILVYTSDAPFVNKASSIQVTERALADAGITHGSHAFRVEGYVIINGEYHLIQTLNYNIMLIDVNDDTPIIISYRVEVDATHYVEDEFEMIVLGASDEEKELVSDTLKKKHL